MRTLITSVILSGLCSCAAPEDTRMLVSSSAEEASDEEESADEPVMVGGAFLSCSMLSEAVSPELMSVGCSLMSPDTKEPMDLAIYAESVDWQYASTDVINMAEDYYSQDGSLWHVRFDFDRSSYEVDSSIITDFSFSLKLTERSSGEEIQVTKSMKDVLKQLFSHRYLQMAVSSIYMNEASEDVSSLEGLKLEFKVDGKWQAVKFSLANIDYENRQINSDTYAISFQGSVSDWLMFLTSGMASESASQIIEAFGLWYEKTDGNWVFSDGVSFSSEPPYLVKEDVGVVGISIDLKEAGAVQGLRLNGGEQSSLANLANGFPKSFHFLVSEDATNWIKVPGSNIDISDLSKTEWEWD